MLKIIGFLSIIAVILLACTYILNIQNIENKGRNVDSYHDISPWIYIFFGIIALLAAYPVFRIHPMATIIPVGLGALSLVYGFYLASIKIGVLV